MVNFYIFSYFLRLPKAALEIWELPPPSCMNVWLQIKEAIATWKILRGITCADDLRFYSSWPGILCLRRVYSSGQEVFCLRRAYSSWPGILLSKESFFCIRSRRFQEICNFRSIAGQEGFIGENTGFSAGDGDHSLTFLTVPDCATWSPYIRTCRLLLHSIC